jgi:phosphoribosylaminoimidazolecarboxamide formyltransferase/IMP cyclohydrolase
MEMKFIGGGVLQQTADTRVPTLDQLSVVTETAPDATLLAGLQFAWQVAKHVKSNAIVLAKDFMTVGIGGGQVSRVDAVDLAIRKAGNVLQECVLASDAFFPFRDSIDRLQGTGVRAIIQPGGSVRDQEVIDACNELGIAMVFTGVRCFKH